MSTKIYSVGPDEEIIDQSFQDGVKWIVYWYESGSYDGSGSAYCKFETGEYGFLGLGHCSCYGPFDVSEGHSWDKIDLGELRNYLALQGTENDAIKNQIKKLRVAV